MLREYQQDIVNKAREGLLKHKAFMIQCPTGSGKTIIFSAIVDMAREKHKHKKEKFVTWIIAPRNELVNQAGEHLAKYKIPHGYIRAGSIESRAYDVQVCSKQTLDLRWDKIKNWPSLCIVDEAHLNNDFQKRLFDHVPEYTKILGFTATPELAMGGGLKQPHGIYGDIAYGPSIPYLTACGFLSPIRYFAPPLEGIRDLHFNNYNGDVNEKELDEFLRQRKVYGRAVKYYSSFCKSEGGKHRTLLGFARSVKAAQELARQFKESGYEVHPIDGGMPRKQQKLLLDAARRRKIHGLISCDLVSYGVDIKCIDYIFMMRPTKSRALYFQMVGRGLRPSEGKTDCLIVDHVDNIKNHCDGRFPGIPPFFIEDPIWNFEGNKKLIEKTKAPPPGVRLCRYEDFLVCTKKIRCPECENYAPTEGEELFIEGLPLEERAAPAAAQKAITDAEKREWQDAIIASVMAARGADGDEGYDRAVKQLCDIAEKLNYRPMWCYYQLTANRYTVDERAIHAIARVKGYKPYWAKKEAERIRLQLEGAGA